MSFTLWKIQKAFDEEYITNRIFCKTTNSELIDEIDFDSIDIPKEEFTAIINNFIDNKINRVKPEASEEVKLTSLNINGLNDIKYALNFKEFSFYSELEKDFEIKIICTSSSIYSITIKQKEFDLVDSLSIKEVIDKLKNEIKIRSVEKSILNNISLNNKSD